MIKSVLISDIPSLCLNIHKSWYLTSNILTIKFFTTLLRHMD